MTLPADFVWHQSHVAKLLKCPRRFKLQHVDKLPIDRQQRGYAAVLGTADHSGIEAILHGVRSGRGVTREQVRAAQLAGFERAVERNESQGEPVNPDGIEAAMDLLEGERLERLLVLADDPRLTAVDWQGIEWRFDVTERGGRRWRGCVDAWGVALRDVPAFGADGRDAVGLRRGDKLIVDWKTGAKTELGYTPRRLSVQMAVYAMAVARVLPGTWRTFLGQVQDVDRTTTPRGDDGKRVARQTKALNPDYVEALGVTAAEAEASRKRPRGIPKWLEQANPDYVRACLAPKGPLFHECRVAYPVVMGTLRDAMRLAAEGIYPASGSLTGQCFWCPYQGICTEALVPEPTTKEEAQHATT